MMDAKTRTIQDFGEQWLAFRNNPGYYGSTALLADLFGPLLSLSEVKRARVAEIGSGSGRIVNMLLDAGAAHVFAIEPSAAMQVLKENTATRAEQVTYIQASGESIPAGLDLDIIISIGVLHHIPEPDAVLAASFQSLRAGGRLLVWLYGREGNEGYLRWAEPLRRLTTHLPHPALVALSYALAAPLELYIALCRFLPLPMRHYMREVLANFSRPVRRLTIYDQLNPTYAKYYTRAEAEALLRRAGFIDVQSYHRHGYSWTVLGRRPG